MTRIASQLLYCSPDRIVRNAVLERNSDLIVSNIYDLKQVFEMSNTLFYDGIISAEILSVKQNTTSNVIDSIAENYKYVDLSLFDLKSHIELESKELILDFGTSNVSDINKILHNVVPYLHISTTELVAACVFRPSFFLGINSKFDVSTKCKTLLWQHSNLIENTFDSSINILDLDSV